MRVLRWVLLVPVLLGAFGWAALAIWFDGPTSRLLAGGLIGVLLATAVAALVGLRPRWRALTFLAAVWAVVLGWWLRIPPSNDRDWQPDVARPAEAIFAGDVVTIRNVRNFDYRSETDFTERWEDRTYDLGRIVGADLFLSFWGPTLIAHTIMSWEFDDGRHLAISIETRKQKGEEYSAVRGFFRQYELYYVVADERDVVRLRTNYRGEEVFLYRLRANPDRARATLRAYLAAVDRLAHTPRWYNALSHNCTTTIRLHVEQAGGSFPWDWRILANGRADELLYERGAINRSLPFPILRAQSDITARARAADGDAEFSADIREGLPARPPRE